MEMGCLLASTAPHERSAGRPLSSCSRLINLLQAKKAVNYAIDPESDEEDEDDEDAFKPTKKGRASKRRKTSVESDDDVFVEDDAVQSDVVEEGKLTPIHKKSNDHDADILRCR